MCPFCPPMDPGLCEICIFSSESLRSGGFSIILFTVTLEDINIAFVLRILAIILFLSHHSKNIFKSIFLRFVRCKIQESEENN